MTRIPLRWTGAGAGLLFAWLIVQYGFFRAVFIAFLTGLGWFAGRWLDGEIRLGPGFGAFDRGERED